jgi:hypothetical protein
MSRLGIYASQISGHLAPPPPPVSGYSLWLDAADTTTISVSGTAVTQWNDKSANALTFTQSTSYLRPLSGVTTQNSLNVIDFDGSDDFLNSTAATSAWKYLSDGTQHTMFLVTKCTDINLYPLIFGNINSANVGTSGLGIRAASGTNATISTYINNGSGGTGVVVYTDGGSYTQSNWAYFTGRMKPSDGTPANRAITQVNQATATNNNTSNKTPSSSNPNYTLTIGGVRNNSGDMANLLKGSIGEILIYSSYLNDSEVLSIQQYFASKWAI